MDAVNRSNLFERYKKYIEGSDVAIGELLTHEQKKKYRRQYIWVGIRLLCYSFVYIVGIMQAIHYLFNEGGFIGLFLIGLVIMSLDYYVKAIHEHFNESDLIVERMEKRAKLNAVQEHKKEGATATTE